MISLLITHFVIITGYWESGSENQLALLGHGCTSNYSHFALHWVCLDWQQNHLVSQEFSGNTVFLPSMSLRWSYTGCNIWRNYRPLQTFFFLQYKQPTEPWKQFQVLCKVSPSPCWFLCQCRAICSRSICSEWPVFLKADAFVKMQLRIAPLIYQRFHAKQIFSERQHALAFWLNHRSINITGLLCVCMMWTSKVLSFDPLFLIEACLEKHTILSIVLAQYILISGLHYLNK